MLKDYLDKLSEARQAHPISEGDYEQFKDNPIFKRLLNDIEESILYQLDTIGSTPLSCTTDEIAMNAIKFNEAQNSLEFIREWIPEELSEGDE